MQQFTSKIKKILQNLCFEMTLLFLALVDFDSMLCPKSLFSLNLEFASLFLDIFIEDWAMSKISKLNSLGEKIDSKHRSLIFKQTYRNTLNVLKLCLKIIRLKHLISQTGPLLSIYRFYEFLYFLILS